MKFTIYSTEFKNIAERAAVVCLKIGFIETGRLKNNLENIQSYY